LSATRTKAQVDPAAPSDSRNWPDAAIWEVAKKRGHHRIAQGRPFWQHALF